MIAHYWQQIDGWFAFREAFDVILADLPNDSASTFVELGTWVGRSTAYLGVAIAQSGKPVTLVAVDHFKGSLEIHKQPRVAMVPDSEALFRKNLAPVAAVLGPRFRVLVGDSAQAAEQFADGSIDAAWVDAAHSYELVARDLDAWWPKVRIGGILGGDDWVKCPGVAQAVIERFTAAAAVDGTAYWMIRRAEDGSACPMGARQQVVR